MHNQPMQWDTTDDVDQVVLHVTRQEVRMLNNALSASLDLPERVFPTLMGATQSEVAGLLNDFRQLRGDLPG